MKKNYYQRLSKILTAIFFGLVIVPILIISIISIKNLKESSIHKIGVLEKRLVQYQKDTIASYLNQQLELLSTIVGIFSLEQMADKKRLEQLYTSINRSGDIVDLQIIDSSGKQLSYVGPYRKDLQGKNYYEALWFQDVLVSGEHISDVFEGFRNIPHLVVAVTDPLKNYVLRATINSETFNSFLHSAQIGPNGDAFIVNRQGEFQTPSLLGLDKLTEDDKQLLKFHEGAATTTLGSYLYATQWMKEGHWLVVVKSKISDSLQLYVETRNRYIYIILAISTICLTGAMILSIFLVGKLEQTDRQRADLDHQMVQVEKMATVGRLAAGIAHEINNPLQMITTQSGWIEELLPEEDPEKVINLGEYEKAIGRIRFHAKRAGTVTQRLLGFSRKMSSEKEFVNINELIEETISFVDNEAINKEITIELKLAEDIPSTMTDGPQLQQVLLNVLNNGLDAVDEGGKIDISTKLLHNSIIIEFADNGPGISRDVKRQIFDPFFTTKDPGQGTGLGLYICYDIMKKLGGNIDAKNGADGGAVFTLVVPVRRLGDS